VAIDAQLPRTLKASLSEFHALPFRSSRLARSASPFLDREPRGKHEQD